jgi:hypothetical protein
MTSRTQLKAGGIGINHNETLQLRPAVKAANNIVWMRRQPLTTSHKEDRLELLVVRAGLRAGKRARARD